MSHTISEQMKLRRERQLQRIERANPDHFRFPRETSSKQRRISFVADRRDKSPAAWGIPRCIACLALATGARIDLA